MNRNTKMMCGVATIAVAGLIAWPVYAHCGKCAKSAQDMLTRMQQSDTDLTKAIDMAQKQSGGKALAAFSELGKNSLDVDVYCLKGDKILAVTVDIESGKVTATEEAKAIPIPSEKHEHPHGG